MIFGLVGTPSPLTYITTNVIRAIVEVTRGHHLMIGANCANDLRETWRSQERPAPPVVIASDMPRDDFVGFLLKTGVQIIVCIERFEDICNYMVTCRSFDGIAAIRVATQSLSNLEPLAVDPSSSMLKITVSDETFAETVLRLLRFYKLPKTEDTIDRVAAHLGFAGGANLRFSDFLAQSKKALFPDLEGDLLLSQADFEALETISRSYNNILSGRRIDDVYWQGYCFLEVNSPGIPITGALTLEGKARFLTYGPYFNLPIGGWAAEVIIEIDECFSENRIGFDVHASSVLAARTTTLPADGALACDMIFHVADSNLPIEIRIQLLTGAIEGKLRLRGVRFKRI